MGFKLVNWNVEWAGPRSRRSSEILRRIRSHIPEIVCLTETHMDLLSEGGHSISSRPDYGHAIKEGRRKVLLWSRAPWSNVNTLGSESLPPGRFVSGVTQSSVGELMVIGVCIPWSRSRVSGTGPRRPMWADHREYLEGLSGILQGVRSQRVIVMGDFNQRIGASSSTPHILRSSLLEALPASLTIATSGVGFRGRRTIDHIALSSDLAVESLSVISNFCGEKRLSDHFGVAASVSVKPTQSS